MKNKENNEPKEFEEKLTAKTTEFNELQQQFDELQQKFNSLQDYSNQKNQRT